MTTICIGNLSTWYYYIYVIKKSKYEVLKLCLCTNSVCKYSYYNEIVLLKKQGFGAQKKQDLFQGPARNRQSKL